MLIATTLFSQTTGVWDVYSFGATGDGKTLDTKAIQTAIDQCAQAGGGKVYLHNGTFLSGTIYLQSNISLEIEAGAILLGSPQQSDYPVTKTKHPSYHGELLSNRMLIFAEEAENIAITGNGTIDGNGENFIGIDSLEALKERPRIIHLRACKNIKIKDITLRNSASWVQNYSICEDLLIDGITVDSRENNDIEKARFADAPGRNTDGLDIVDCRNVRIANCFINSGDDGICLKSLSRKEACRNITITNCVITTNASGIKLGTESVGGFQDINISNCSIYDCRLGGVDIMCVDGAQTERIVVSNITLRNIKGTAIFVRLGNRGRMHRNGETAATGSVKDISIQNIYGTKIGRYGCSITGIPTARVQNVVLENINLAFEGGNKPLWFQGEEGKAVQKLTIDNVPEVSTKHPRGDMFGQLPAYGFYVRHTDNIHFNNVQLRTMEADERPAVILADVTEATVEKSSFEPVKQ
ncbi:exo-poly-alpha-D-galacturonosidase [Bacteroidia bacterium]|nr:exo-poly-alpha-D-galacturonosidase [Bacteroidia bacterium]